MAVTAKTTMTQADFAPALEELLDEIINGEETHWQQYASRMAAEVAAGFKIGLFSTWSSNNRFYLASQVRSRRANVHGMYAGVEQWRKRNRTVRDGEQPFVIFGPPTFRLRPGAGAPAQQQANQPALPVVAPAQQPANQQPQPAVVVGYRRPPIIEVFDYTQTVSNDPDYVEPDWAIPLAGGDLSTLHRLTQVSPVPVKFASIGSKREHGWLDSTGITVDESLTVAAQISTLAHELGHHHLGHLEVLTAAKAGDERDQAREKCEQEAAMTEFLVMKMLGLDESIGLNVTAAAGQYLRHWVKTNADGTTTPIAGHKGRRKLLKARFDVAFRAAQTIVNAYAKPDEDADKDA